MTDYEITTRDAGEMFTLLIGFCLAARYDRDEMDRILADIDRAVTLLPPEVPRLSDAQALESRLATNAARFRRWCERMEDLHD
ncbi:MAG: hypothetical protein F4X76_05190 [Chloroflexi bacterium]|nr:hypothetical protein [Chloroflexota bacterium]